MSESVQKSIFIVGPAEGTNATEELLEDAIDAAAQTAQDMQGTATRADQAVASATAGNGGFQDAILDYEEPEGMSKADGKPGESLDETPTAELQETHDDLTEKPDPQTAGRRKAIAGELKQRGVQKSLDDIASEMVLGKGGSAIDEGIDYNEILEKAHYTKRTGGPGHYKYEYADDGKVKTGYDPASGKERPIHAGSKTVGANLGRVGFDAKRDADMSWLGEPPSAKESAAYEEKRAKVVDVDKRETKQANAGVTQSEAGSGNVKIATPSGPKEVRSMYQSGNFHAHEDAAKPGKYAVTHGPSGLQVGGGHDMAAAFKQVEHFDAHAGDALSDLKFGQRPTAKHKPGMDRLVAAHKDWQAGKFKSQQSAIDKRNEADSKAREKAGLRQDGGVLFGGSSALTLPPGHPKPAESEKSLTGIDGLNEYLAKGGTPVGGITPGGYKKVGEHEYVKDKPKEGAAGSAPTDQEDKFSVAAVSAVLTGLRVKRGAIPTFKKLGAWTFRFGYEREAKQFVLTLSKGSKSGTVHVPRNFVETRSKSQWFMDQTHRLTAEGLAFYGPNISQAIRTQEGKDNVAASDEAKPKATVIGNATTAENETKKSLDGMSGLEEYLEKGEGEGTRGGHIVGHYPSGKPIYSRYNRPLGDSLKHAEEHPHGSYRVEDHGAGVHALLFKKPKARYSETISYHRDVDGAKAAIKRHSAHASDPKMSEAASKVAQAATTGNPVNVMALGKIHDMALDHLKGGKTHEEAVAAVKQAIGGPKMEKSMYSGIDALEAFAKGGLPSGESKLDQGHGDASPNGGDLTSTPRPKAEGAASPSQDPGAPSVPEEKLSEDDDSIGSQLKGGEPGMKEQAVAMGKSFQTYSRRELDQTVAREKAAWEANLRKGQADVVAGVGIAAPQTQPEALEKAQYSTQGEDARVLYSNASDLACERLFKSDNFYQGGEPSLGFCQPAFTRMQPCGSCGGQMSKSLSACPHCGVGATMPEFALSKAEAAAPVQNRRGPGLRPSRGQADLVLPNGVKLGQE